MNSLRGASKAKKVDKPKVKAGFPRIWFFVLLVLGAFVLGDLNQRMADAHRLEQEADLLTEELGEFEEGIVQLRTEIERANDQVTIERWAREEAKMVRPGEHLVILIAPDGKPLEAHPTEAPAEPLPSNMQIWLELLFGR